MKNKGTNSEIGKFLARNPTNATRLMGKYFPRETYNLSLHYFANSAYMLLAFAWTYLIFSGHATSMFVNLYYVRS